VTFGRKRALTDDQCKRIRTLRQEEKFSVAQLAERFNVGVATVYRVLQEPA